MSEMPMDGDHESIIDQCALEAMHAIEMKDTEKFVEALHVLVGDLLSKLSTDDQGGAS